MSRRGAAVCFNGLLGGARHNRREAYARVFPGFLREGAKPLARAAPKPGSPQTLLPTQASGWLRSSAAIASACRRTRAQGDPAFRGSRRRSDGQLGSRRLGCRGNDRRPKTCR